MPDWAVQMLTAVDAVVSSELKCSLASVSDQEARVTFTGTLEGARLGAHTTITMSGHYLYDLEHRLIRRLELDHSETASIGAVSPGLDSKVHVACERTLAADAGRLTDELTASIPLDPPGDRLPLTLDAPPWGVRLEHDRNWHVFHTSFDPDRPVIILRLLDMGSLVAQSNVSLVPAVEAGQQTPLAEFEQNIRHSLGDQFLEVIDRGRVPSGDGRMIQRVIVRGEVPLGDTPEAERLEMNWIYYLVTHPSGRQVSFLFAVEPEQRERLLDRDVTLVRSLQFLEPKDRQASSR